MGWDEAFVGAQTDDPEALAAGVRAAVLAAAQLACSVGIGDNMLRAKIATEFAKPPGGTGTFRLTAANWDAVMRERPTRALWGIGAKTAAKLADRGLHTVAQLGAADPAALAADLGPALGPYYVQLGRGIGRVVVDPTPWVRRSRSRETTFQADLTDPVAVRAEITALARRVAADLVGDGRPAARLGVTVRFAPFHTHTRSVTLDAPTADPGLLEDAALRVLGLFAPEVPGDRAVRLLGVRAELERP
jgi:DNA polymerase-4